MEEMEAVVDSVWFDPASLDLWTSCFHWSVAGAEQQARSLNALTFATNLYNSMPDSTISIEVINSTMYGVSWANSIEPESLPTRKHALGMWWHKDEAVERSSVQKDLPSDQFSMTDTSKQDSDVSVYHGDEDGEPSERLGPIFRQGSIELEQEFRQPYNDAQEDRGLQIRRAFSCIAWFDSGEFDIPLKNLNAVMALANGASIYVASELLVDPSASTADAPIQRVFGNLGRSELCLLIPPADPRLASPDVRSWKLINHMAFDGQLQDSFGGTTLHLTFTESEDAVYVGNRGLRDRQVVLLEALISIDDRGRNIGDLDILSMFNRSSIRVNEKCTHATDKEAADVADWGLTAVDCWEEFLDPPNGMAIFRACSNWQARLGATAAAVQTGKKVLVLPEKACLHCLAGSVKERVDIIIA
ncbi:uncharacterized protein J4E92_010107 [Alternaria infectoria]|uniref:uncharacterized protein n=1 Tax=Alternaria infectoria TaxID=45303 RepID=UPI00221F8B47|nr:uncharacterized protein J4E92_010107 [Alternaria infectoria]KAI4912256.1 hypothetical protein J4E92_010107 [Alternaria infectoria]